MPPKLPLPQADDLFRSRLDTIIDTRHPLVRLSQVMD